MKGEISYLGITTEFTKASLTFYRNLDYKNKPCSVVFFRGFNFSIPTSPEGLHFLEEFLNIDKQFYDQSIPDPTPKDIFKPFIIKIYDDEGYTIRTIELIDAHIKNYKEVFTTSLKYSTSSNTSMFINMNVVSAIQRINQKALNVFWWHHSDYKLEEYKSPVQEIENRDKFYLSIKHLTNKKTFTPLGIPAFNGTPENKNIEFEIEITENDIDDFQVEFLHDNKVIQTYYSGRQTLDEVVITAKGSGNTSNSNASNNQNAQSNYPKGKYSLKWDGFNSNGIYDSTIFTTGKLKARIKGRRNGKEKTAESSEFAFDYKEVKWVDVKINKNTKRIDVTLRVNLKDGGEKGTEKDCYETGSGSYAPITKHCPWEKIPKKEIDPKDPILKARNENNNFDALKQLAMDGIEKYWGRNNTNIGKGVYIDEELYEVFISCKQDEQGMVAPKIIYFTNSENTTFNRSHNWFASRKLYYKEGYLKNDRWDYRSSSVAIVDFKETAAHEIGHELLAKLSGKYHSYTHKGTSHPSVIIQNPVKGTKYPTDGKEIDLMKYAEESYPYDYYKRIILSEKDLLGLLWLTKLELK
ncbi:hypothetical protein [Tenacibaculum maritimum]|uniref:hypothetical protein n=1 Tax=Tenacibaculum maritimum TaxID=107401 RepID=UPI003890C004